MTAAGAAEPGATSQRGARVDFAALNARLLADAERHVAAWLPAGHRRGREWCSGNLAGAAGESLKVNLDTGRWSDFATNESGGDLVALYAAINNLDQAEAARALGAQPPAEFGVARKRSCTEWRPIVPVPPDAPAFRLSHRRYGAPLATWRYRDAAQRLLGVVCRF